MINIEIQSNPNCPESPQYVYNEIGQWAPFSAIRVLDRDGESICDVVGVDAQGNFIKPKYIKINDSAEGTVYLLYGGEWGIRLRPCKYASEEWDLNNAHQWGEPFKIYGDEKDIIL